MTPIAVLINKGFEIKAATTYEVANVIHQSILLQMGTDVFVCVFKMNSMGGFNQVAGAQLG